MNPFKSRWGPNSPNLPDGAKPFGRIPGRRVPWSYEIDRARDLGVFARRGSVRVVGLGLVTERPPSLYLARGAHPTDEEILIVLRALFLQTTTRAVPVFSPRAEYLRTISWT